PSGLALRAVDEASDDADRLPARHEDAADAAAAVEPCALRQRARHVRHVHRLLRVLRTAEGADAGREAAALVARDARARVAERDGAALEEATVPPVQLVGHGPHAQLLLDALEVRPELRLADAGDAVALRPFVEDPVRSAVAGPGVDRRR